MYSRCTNWELEIRDRGDRSRSSNVASLLVIAVLMEIFD